MKKALFAGIVLVLLIATIAIAQENEQVTYDASQGEYNVEKGKIVDIKIGNTLLKGVDGGKVTSENNFELTISATNENVIIAGKTFEVIPSGSRIINDNGVIRIISPSSLSYAGGVYDANGQTITVKQDGAVDLPAGTHYERPSSGVVVTGPATIHPQENKVVLQQGSTYTNTNYNVKATSTEGELIIYEGLIALDTQTFIARSNFDNALRIDRKEILASGKYRLEVGKLDFRGKGDQGLDYGDEGAQKIPLSDTALTHYKSFSIFEKYTITNSDVAGVKYQIVRNEKGSVVAWVGAPGAAAKATEEVSEKLSDAAEETKVKLYIASRGRFGITEEQAADSPPEVLIKRRGLAPTDVSDTWREGGAPEGQRTTAWIYIVNSKRWQPVKLTRTLDGFIDQNGNPYDGKGQRLLR